MLMHITYLSLQMTDDGLVFVARPTQAHRNVKNHHLKK